jgi:hypothetical protein
MFEDMISIEAELRQLKIDNEELAKLVDDYKGMTNIILKQRQDMTFLLHEAKFFLDEFKENLSEEDFKQYERAADRRFQNWIKEEFEIDQVSVEATLKP